MNPLHQSDSTATGRTCLVVLLLFVIVWTAIENTALSAPYEIGKEWLGITPNPSANTLRCAPYALQMTLRLVWWLIATAVVFRYDKEVIEWLRFPRHQQINFLKGLVLGLAVMCAVLGAIVALGDARIWFAPGSIMQHLSYALAWLASEILGAAGEELLYRVVLLLIVMRLFGARVAIVVSAVTFAAGHLANPGVSAIWIIRLFAAGLLLGYTVIRSRSMWWAVGYHAGWNFASAPLFGATGSGFDDEGSQFHFLPSGSDLVTGGAVGPEGSLFAFVAVAIAATVMLKTLRPAANA